MTTVILEAEESFESALKRFKKLSEKRKALAARKKAQRRERFFD